MSTVLPLPTLIDLAVGSTDAVNFSLLNSLLHVIVQQLELLNVKVEFRGPDSERIQGLLTGEDQMAPKVDFKIIDIPEEAGTEEPDQLHQKGSVESTDSKGRKISSSELVHGVDSGKVADGSVKAVLKTSSFGSIARLEGKVKVLQTEIEEIATYIMPSNESLLEVTRTNLEAKPISELIHGLNISKRMTGAEEGIDKLASLLETVTKEYADLKTVIDTIKVEFGQDMNKTIHQIQVAADYAHKIRPKEELYPPYLRQKLLEKKMSETTTENQETEEAPKMEKDELEILMDKTAKDLEQYFSIPILPFDEESITAEKLNKFLGQHEFVRRNVEYLNAQVSNLADVADIIIPEALEGMPHLTSLKEKIAEIRAKGLSDGSLTSLDIKQRSENLSVNERLEDLESTVGKHSSKLRRQDVLFCEKIDSVSKKMEGVENNLILVNKKLHLTAGNEGVEEDQEELANNTIIKNLVAKNQEFDDELTAVKREFSEFQEEKNKKQSDMDVILKKLENLNIAKCDRFELDDVLAEKATLDQLKEKVSQDQLDTILTEIERTLTGLEEKIDSQEKKSNSDFEDLMKKCNAQLSKEQMETIQSDLEEKIKNLKFQIEEVASLREKREAAGTKLKLLKNVNCISCNEDVVMRTCLMKAPAQVSPSNPHHENQRPFLLYELDNIRKLTAKIPGGRNLIQYEQIMKKYLSDSRTSINRFVGGKHTATGPEQRIPRKGPVISPSLIQNISNQPLADPVQ